MKPPLTYFYSNILTNVFNLIHSSLYCCICMSFLHACQNGWWIFMQLFGWPYAGFRQFKLLRNGLYYILFTLLLSHINSNLKNNSGGKIDSPIEFLWRYPFWGPLFQKSVFYNISGCMSVVSTGGKIIR